MRSMYPWITIIEYLGVIAFAASGSMKAMKKHMDPFGVLVLGLVEATGGGILRDLLLGITPPSMFRDPTYAMIALATSAVISIAPIRRLLTAKPLLYDKSMLVFDTIGIGVFTVIGVRTTVAAYPAAGIFPMLFVGTIAATGGGMLRDILARDVPVIFTKHIYALACLLGAAVCALLWHKDNVLAMLLGAATVVVIRLLAAHFKWNLPASEL